MASPPSENQPDRELYALRALRAHEALQRTFGSSRGYWREGRIARLGVSAHLWPVARAFVATLDLAGVDRSLLPGFDRQTAITRDLAALERYWDPRGPAPAYASDVRRSLLGGDRYYDDNAWVGLGLVQMMRLQGGDAAETERARWLQRAAAVWRFALTGVDRPPGSGRGGIYWVEQGRGIGRRNHDRNTVSTAPNVAVALHLTELGVSGIDVVCARALFDWVLGTLDRAGDGCGPFWDKIRGDGSIDRALWSYNQGNMIGVRVLLARLECATNGTAPGGAATGRAKHDQAEPGRAGDSQSHHLLCAEQTARRTLEHFAGGRFDRQPAEFNAICFRNLLQLHHASSDGALRAAIVDEISAYADRAWDHARDRQDRFHLRDDGVTLLGQSALVQILALLAWDPRQYGLLA